MRRELDQFDMEAEREGLSVKKMMINNSGPKFAIKNEARKAERFFVKRLSEIPQIVRR